MVDPKSGTILTVLGLSFGSKREPWQLYITRAVTVNHAPIF